MKVRQVDIDIFTTNVSYDDAKKRVFHLHAGAILKALAKELGYQKGDFDLRHNQGGIAVSGEIILHSDNLYVQISQSALGPDHGFMWRVCRNRHDYTGLQNRWAKWEKLLDLPSLAREMQQAVEQRVQAPR